MRCLSIVLLLAGAAASPGAFHTGAFEATTAAFLEEDGGAVRLRAVVTDTKGQAVVGLTASDFDLAVDGAPQTIDTVELVRAATGDRRAFAFLLDEFHVAPADSTAVRDALLSFVDGHLRQADVALVFKPLDSLDAIAVTSDRAALRQAIETFEGRKGDYAPRTDFERRYMAQAPAAVAAARAQIVTSALRAIGTSLSQRSDARAAIVLVSDGFGRMRTGRNMPANLQAAIRVANRAAAPVYAFAPALAPPAPDEAREEPAFAALTALTTETGGQLVVGPAELARGLTRLAADLDAHYVVTYRPAHGSDGRFHEVRLGTTRPGAQVRTQAGYVAAPTPAVRAAAAPAMSAPLRVLRRSSLIQSWAGFFPVAADRGTVTLTWEPARARSAARGRAASIVITATTPDGAVLFDAAVGPAGSKASDERPNAATFEAPLGPVRVDMKILDDTGVVIDTDARDVTAPAMRADRPTIYPPAIVRARSAREFREALENAQAAPVATREFRRTDRLLIRVPAVDASGAPVPVTAVLLNRLRQPMRPIPALDAPAPRHSTQFDLSLAPLAPGEYSLRLSVSGPAGAPAVTDHVTFRVER